MERCRQKLVKFYKKKNQSNFSDAEFAAGLDHIEPHDVGNEDGTLNLTGVPEDRVNIYKALLLSTCFTASSAGTIMLTAVIFFSFFLFKHS